jgi:ribonuclease D
MTEPQTWTLVTSEDDLQAMMQALRAQSAIAVDTESNSLYAYRERVCLIQISVPGADYIVDPLAGLDLSPLGEVFADPGIQKVFHAAEQDIAGLKRDFGFRFANLFDTMRAARILGWPRAGLADLLREHFGVHTDKRYQRYNWGQRPLSPDALQYAAWDTRYLLLLRDRQVRELERRGRMRQAAESFARLAQTPTRPAPLRSRRLLAGPGGPLPGRPGAGRPLATLPLAGPAWPRSGTAPPFRIMGDEVLVRLARVRPRTLGELAALGRFPAYWLRRHGPEILEAVARGKTGRCRPRPAPLIRPTCGHGTRRCGTGAVGWPWRAGWTPTSSCPMPSCRPWPSATPRPCATWKRWTGWGRGPGKPGGRKSCRSCENVLPCDSF